jgi:putative peptide zinc metalloprotease protein
MATLAESLVSSSGRKMSIRKRADLSARRQRYMGQNYWVVKEPVGLNYFRFQDEEFAILNMIDGDSSLDEIKERFEAEFPPQKITLEELQQFLGMLHRSGLIVADVPGQGHQLRKRRDDRRRKEIIGAMSNILCIRFKGFDPERFLNWLYPKVKWLFSPVTVGFCFLLIAAALSLILVEFDTFRSKLPDFYQFFSLHNAVWLAIVLGCSKVLHEFGHGLFCKHFGGECHEMGVMILVLTPCLYCNVSDSWMLPSKWQRAAIGAAGIYVEMVLASICAFVWWFSTPGLLNNVCLNMMFIASVSTLLFNGNPLLRYDGYYVLADLVEIPNLRQKATNILNAKMGEWFLGLEAPEDPFLPKQNQVIFMLYTVAAVIYRWFIMVSILFFLYRIFDYYGLRVIGHVMVAMSLWGLVGMPLYKLAKFFYVPGRLHKVKKPRMYATLGALAVLVAAIFLVPLPYTVPCILEIKARDAAWVYVDVPGRLDAVEVKAGDAVTQGQTLARLSDLDLELEIAQLRSERDQQQARLISLQARQYHDPQARDQVLQTQEALLAAENQLAEKMEDRKRLRLVAPRDGVVLPPSWVKEPEENGDQLASWSATPLDARNLGAYLRESVPFCQIADPELMEASLVIDQSEIDFVEIGQKVDIKLDELPHDTLDGKIKAISPEAIEVAPKRLSTKAGGELPTRTDEQGVERPQSAAYQASVYLEDPDGLLRVGLRGHAKIHARWQTLSTRIWRLITETFRLKL